MDKGKSIWLGIRTFDMYIKFVHNSKMSRSIMKVFRWQPLFSDLLVGTGFFYAIIPAALPSSDLQASDHAY